MAISKEKVRIEISVKKNTYELVKGVAENSNLTKSQVFENCVWLSLADALKPNHDTSSSKKKVKWYSEVMSNQLKGWYRGDTSH